MRWSLRVVIGSEYGFFDLKSTPRLPYSIHQQSFDHGSSGQKIIRGHLKNSFVTVGMVCELKTPKREEEYSQYFDER